MSSLLLVRYNMYFSAIYIYMEFFIYSEHLVAQGPRGR